MKRKTFLAVAITAIAVLTSMTIIAVNAEARAGGGRSIGGGSMGGRGSRSYSAPASPSSRQSQQAVPRPQASPPPFQSAQPAGGGFLRNMAGGIAGGFLGSMLFRGLAGAGGLGGAGGAGGGIGIFEILLIGGIIYLGYRIFKKKQTESPQGQLYNFNSQEPAKPALGGYDEVDTGINSIRQMDPSFNEQRFPDQVMDMFFKIQSAWMSRNLATVANIMTQQIRSTFQEDIDRLLREHKINRLENIAVRSVEISEAWQESGQDYITTLVYANLLDYTTDDRTDQIIEGSKTDPVKFEEFWTFTRASGNNQWQLSAINQK